MKSKRFVISRQANTGHLNKKMEVDLCYDIHDLKSFVKLEEIQPPPMLGGFIKSTDIKYYLPLQVVQSLDLQQWQANRVPLVAPHLIGWWQLSTAERLQRTCEPPVKDRPTRDWKRSESIVCHYKSTALFIFL